MTWLLDFGATVVAAMATATIAWILLRSASRHEYNRLAVGIALVFFTIAGSEAARALQYLYPWFGVGPPLDNAARAEGGHWHVWVSSWLVGAAGLVYLGLRSRYRHLLEGPVLYEDLHARHQRALTLHDTVVQRLAFASWSLDLGNHEDARQALRRTLQDAAVTQHELESVLGSGGGDDGDGTPEGGRAGRAGGPHG